MELENKIYIGKLIDRYGPLLTDKQLSSVENYYLFDISLSEIAQNNQISRQAAYDLVTKSKNLLISYEQKLNVNATLTSAINDLLRIVELEKDDQLKNKLHEVINKLR